MEILLRFFRNTQVISLLALLALLLLLRIPVFFIDITSVETPTMPISKLFLSLIPNREWVYKLFALFLIGLQAIYFNKIMVSQHIIKRNSFLPAFFYVIFSSMIPEMHTLHPAIFANSFLLLALQKTHGLYKLKKAQFRIFDAGLYIGLTILCFLPSVWYVVILIVGLTSYQIAGIKYHIISLLGVLCTIYLWATWVFFQENSISILENFFFNPFDTNRDIQWGDLHYLSVYLTFAFIALIAIRDLFLFIKQKDIKARKAFQINYTYLVLSFLALCTLPIIDFRQLHFLVIPISGITANYYLYTKKKKLPSVALFLLLVSIFYLQWYQ